MGFKATTIAWGLALALMAVPFLLQKPGAQKQPQRNVAEFATYPPDAPEAAQSGNHGEQATPSPTLFEIYF